MVDNGSSETEGDDGMLRQVGFIDLIFMFTTRKEGKFFNLARSLKEFLWAGKAFDKELSIMPLFGDGSAICKPQDMSNSHDQLAIFYRHHIRSNNVSGWMKIGSNSTIAQLKHHTSTFKRFLVSACVHINNTQLGPEEGIMMGWITG
jgi:hypothetical protein